MFWTALPVVAAKLRYYLRKVDNGVAHTRHWSENDQHLPGVEQPGMWLGAGLPAFGLRRGTQVDDGEIMRLWAGAFPLTGEKIPMRAANQAGERCACVAMDVTVKSPKSVAVLWALTLDERIREVLETSHHVGVHAGIEHLERVVGARRRVGGEDIHLRTGLVVAAMTHHTSQDGDPLLHTHCLTHNVGQADGKYSRLATNSISAHVARAGHVAARAQREYLTKHLGVEWTEVVDGRAEIAGMTHKQLMAFSRRRVDIEDELGQREDAAKLRGEEFRRTAAAQSAAALATRPLAIQGAGTDARPAWRETAKKVGLGPAKIASLTPGPKRVQRLNAEDAAVAVIGKIRRREPDRLLDRNDSWPGSTLAAACADVGAADPWKAAAELANRLKHVRGDSQDRVVDSDWWGGENVRWTHEWRLELVTELKEQATAPGPVFPSGLGEGRGVRPHQRELAQAVAGAGTRLAVLEGSVSRRAAQVADLKAAMRPAGYRVVTLLDDQAVHEWREQAVGSDVVVVPAGLPTPTLQLVVDTASQVDALVVEQADSRSIEADESTAAVFASAGVGMVMEEPREAKVAMVEPTKQDEAELRGIVAGWAGTNTRETKLARRGRIVVDTAERLDETNGLARDVLRKTKQLTPPAWVGAGAHRVSIGTGERLRVTTPVPYESAKVARAEARLVDEGPRGKMIRQATDASELGIRTLASRLRVRARNELAAGSRLEVVSVGQDHIEAKAAGRRGTILISTAHVGGLEHDYAIEMSVHEKRPAAARRADVVLPRDLGAVAEFQPLRRDATPAELRADLAKAGKASRAAERAYNRAEFALAQATDHVDSTRHARDIEKERVRRMPDAGMIDGAIQARPLRRASKAYDEAKTKRRAAARLARAAESRLHQALNVEAEITHALGRASAEPDPEVRGNGETGRHEARTWAVPAGATYDEYRGREWTPQNDGTIHIRVPHHDEFKESLKLLGGHWRTDKGHTDRGVVGRGVWIVPAHRHDEVIALLDESFTAPADIEDAARHAEAEETTLREMSAAVAKRRSANRPLDLSVATEWAEEGFGPDDANAWHLAGFNIVEAKKWRGVGFRPREAERVVAADKRRAAVWQAPADAAFDKHRGSEWSRVDGNIRVQVPFNAAFKDEVKTIGGRWRDGAWVVPESRGHELVRLLDNHFASVEVLGWADEGFAPADAAAWSAAGFNIVEAKKWRGVGFTPGQARHVERNDKRNQDDTDSQDKRSDNGPTKKGNTMAKNDQAAPDEGMSLKNMEKGLSDLGGIVAKPVTAPVKAVRRGLQALDGKSPAPAPEPAPKAAGKEPQYAADRPRTTTKPESKPEVAGPSM